MEPHRPKRQKLSGSGYGKVAAEKSEKVEKVISKMRKISSYYQTTHQERVIRENPDEKEKNANSILNGNQVCA